MSLETERNNDARQRFGATLRSAAVVAVTMIPISRFLNGPGIREDWLSFVKPFGYLLFCLTMLWLAKLGAVLPGALREAVGMTPIDLERLEERDRRAERRMTFCYFLGTGTGMLVGALNMLAQSPLNNAIFVASLAVFASFFWIGIVGIFFVAASDTRASLVVRLSAYFQRHPTSKMMAALWTVLGPAMIVFSAWLISRVVSTW